MLEISPAKVVRVIALEREFGPDATRLYDFIAGLNEDEQASLVALMWIGRESFEADDLEEAIATARTEATAPTPDYLSGIPALAEHLESGMEALGIDVTEEEDDIHGR